jgi:glycosyltransferase involved in cell wall biosynthesis
MVMENIAKANALYRSNNFHEALKLYEKIARKPEWAVLVRANIIICQKKLEEHSKKIDWLLCLRMDEISIDITADDRLAAIIKSLHEKFSPYISITLGMGGAKPSALKILAEWLEDGLIDQSICSGHDDFILNDLVDAAIRSQAPSAIFMNVNDLLDHPSEAINFIVENVDVSIGSTLNPEASFWQASQHALKALPHQLFPLKWKDGLQFVHSAANPMDGKTGAVPTIPAAQTPRHLFLTEAGVERLGGVNKFKTLPIRWGDLPLGVYAKVILLTMSDTSSNALPMGWSRVPAIYPGSAEGKPAVFDIWPAPLFHHKAVLQEDNSWVDVPRQILVGRRCPMPRNHLTNTSAAPKALFIMSNYNKKVYLHAALYGWVMQTHPHVRLEIVDDISTDRSVKKIHEFIRLTDLHHSLLNLHINKIKRGTYWIRNLIISRHLSNEVIFFVNDSDDVSSALRVTMQLAALAMDKDRRACLFNIIRVNNGYAPLPLNNEVERYGTASLCFKPKLIGEIGYFQNIKKNADTEFIRRTRRFIGESSLPWIKYPVLFQPFDHNNLTADIYRINQGARGISENMDSRRLHIEISDRHHERLSLDDLPSAFAFPDSNLPKDYDQLGKDFINQIHA